MKSPARGITACLLLIGVGGVNLQVNGHAEQVPLKIEHQAMERNSKFISNEFTTEDPVEETQEKEGESTDFVRTRWWVVCGICGKEGDRASSYEGAIANFRASHLAFNHKNLGTDVPCEVRSETW